MFQAAISKFVEAVSTERSLLPVPDLASAFHFTPLKVVVKKKPMLFWQKATYELIKGGSLADLLTGEPGGTLVEAEPDHTFLTYDETHMHSLTGEAGVKLRSMAETKGMKSTYVEVTANLGEVVMKEVNQFKLMSALKDRKLDLNSEFVREVRQDRRKVLCVVVGTANLKNSCTLKSSKEKEAEEKVAGGKAGAKVTESAMNEDDSEKQLDLFANTALAFKVCELLVCADGRLELLLDKDSEGGFETANPYD